MKSYLVGGSVRDILLREMHGLKTPKGDNDYLVIGATPEEMLAEGYESVGKHFPVFLHPLTREEYALARRETKVAPGRDGFEFAFGPDVTIEEDVQRRDFTMNALVQDVNGDILDYVGGYDDIWNGVIRHVNEGAFREDALRAFRAARFMAKFGFVVHDDTADLIRSMAGSEDMRNLSAERVWIETEKALRCSYPSEYFDALRKWGLLKIWMPELDALWGVPQHADHHPEVDTFVHTMLSLDRCSELTSDPITRWAIVCHDLGKALTPQGLWPKHYEHDRLGVDPCRVLCNRLKVPSDYRDFALLVTEHHMRCHRIMESRPGSIVKLLDALKVTHGVESLFRFTTACLADARGRLGKEDRRYRDGSFLHAAALAYLSVRPRKDVAGQRVGELLCMDRAQRISELKNRYAFTD